MTENIWHTAYLGVGSNMGDRMQYIENAKALLMSRDDCRALQMSRVIETKPYGDVPQEDYLNCCFRIETTLDPEALLNVLHEIEYSQDRVRKLHWGPRTLDLDILLYDDLIYNSENLIIPHADMRNRFFVLDPLVDLAADVVHPVLHKTVRELYDTLLMEHDHEKREQTDK